MKNRVLLSAAFVLGCLVLGLILGIFTSRYYQTDTELKPEVEGLLWPNPKLIHAFQMVNQNNQPFGLENLSGKWSFLFFGYTHCPDICPITLSVLSQVYNKLAAVNQAENIQIIFVSVDPERDTPEQVAEYVNYFNKNMTGLTGTEQQIETLTSQIGIVHAINQETAPGEYLVDHSASVFLVSPSGQLLAIFSAPQALDDIVNRFKKIREFYSHLEN